MKIAVLCHYGREVGGTESYLSAIIPALANKRNEIALVHEDDGDADRPPVQIPSGVPVWKVKSLGIERATENLRQWKPDVIYAHGLTLPDFEEQALQIAPAILYAHSYYGACISGHKATSFPIVQTCNRHFGSQCLAHYFPRRCGGLNPATMLGAYGLQSRRQKFLQQYKFVVTNSEHMAREFRGYDLNVRCLYLFPRGKRVAQFTPLPKDNDNDPWRLLYLGRMSDFKGGDLLIESLPEVQEKLNRPIHLTLAGSGRQQKRWKTKAAAICRANSQLKIEFPGWLKGEEKEQILARTHLHVLPSLWPEPFGLSGLECGLYGIPSVAFSVGGIPEWLKDNSNGYLAAANPGTAEALASAVVRALEDSESFRQLQRGAMDRTTDFTLEKHLHELEVILEEARVNPSHSPQEALTYTT